VISESNANRYKKLARKGFGDEVVYDRAGVMWVVFRVSELSNVCVRVVGGKYDQVKYDAV